MKKLSFLLAVLLVIMCIPMTAMTTVSAADSTAPDGYVLTETDKANVDANPFKVGDSYYATYDAAYDYARKAGNPNKIEFLRNIEITGDQWYGPAHSSYPSQDLFIEGHGFEIDDNYGSGAYGWKIDNGQTHTVYVNNVIIRTIGFWQLMGNIVCTDVKVYSEITKNANTGVVLLQKNTHVVFDGDCLLKANTAVGVHDDNGRLYRPNSSNPVIAINGYENVVVDIKGNTKIEAANSVMMSRETKGTVMNNVVFNIYDNADIRTVSTDYQGTLLFTCEWRNMGINVYGGYLATIDDTQVVNIGSGPNCTGSYLNVYGGELEDDIWYDDEICDLGLYGGKFTVNGVTYDTNGFTQTKGASIRHTTGSSGIRFQSVIPASVYNSLKDLETAGTITDLKIGTIIVPYDYLNFAYNGQITKDCLDGITYLDIPATNALGAMANYDWETTGVAIRGAIVGIQEKNLDRDFVATGYIEWTDKEGEVFTVYSNPLPTEDNARNVSEIAWEALSQVSSDVTEGYNYSTTTYVADGQLVKNGVATKYSKYDQEAMDNMAALVKQ